MFIRCPIMMLAFALVLAGACGSPTPTAGLHVAFDDGSAPTRQQVFVAAPDGSHRTPIAPSSAVDYGVTGSGDGSVAFTSNRDGNLEVYRVNADGTGVANLTTTVAADGNPVFSRSGAFIAFERAGELFVMAADGTGAQAVAAGNASLPTLPTWSPDDSLLVFARWNGVAEADLWIVGRDGTGLRQLTTTPGRETNPTWAPDGSKLAFGADDDIYVINVDGTGRVNLTNGGGQQLQPAWSPDGTRIAMFDDGDIKTMPAAGGVLSRISSGTDVDHTPQWSPDGTRIMFGRNDSTGATRKIVVANADGSAPSVFAGPTNYVHSMAWVVRP